VALSDWAIYDDLVPPDVLHVVVGDPLGIALGQVKDSHFKIRENLDGRENNVVAVTCMK
jgi:hypothetical protein